MPDQSTATTQLQAHATPGARLGVFFPKNAVLWMWKRIA
jgi:hypothetical protein